MQTNIDDLPVLLGIVLLPIIGVYFLLIYLFRTFVTTNALGSFMFFVILIISTVYILSRFGILQHIGEGLQGILNSRS